MQSLRTTIIILVLIGLCATPLCADTMPVDSSTYDNRSSLEDHVTVSSPQTDHVRLSDEDVQFFANNPDSLRVGGDANTWYQTSTGVIWFVGSILFIGAIIAAT